MTDPANPAHYKLEMADGYPFEVHEVIRARLGRDGYVAWLWGDKIAYAMRQGRKGPALLDLKKQRWFLDQEIAVEIECETERAMAVAEAVDQVASNGQTDPVDLVLAEIGAELERATARHPKMHSLLEGIAILEEEVAELRAEVRRRKPDYAALRTEARQVAAMAVRLELDLLGPTGRSNPDLSRTSWAITQEIHAMATRLQELEREHELVAQAEAAGEEG